MAFRAGDTLTVLVGNVLMDNVLVDNAAADDSLVDDASVEVVIRLVSPEEFTRLTGTSPDPLDPGSGYQGRRLP